MRIWSTSLLYAIMMTGTAAKADLPGTKTDPAPPSLGAAQPAAIQPVAAAVTEPGADGAAAPAPV
ncbi:hypothetical protein C8P66_107129 [Humitalea rosea]|uniref:Uncharacterized protein n=1 Tax=Humitalea rosea TaxID=990373 RepID=A0A2W7ILW3_9PROT|nr:hypothetical protein [Humitalea rosea]PZW47091.1 hypothetical protein C8P66_107129 [Humitalea rosea]